MDWSPRITSRGYPRGWHRPMAMGMGAPTHSIVLPSGPSISSLSPNSGAIGGRVTGAHGVGTK